MLGLVLFCIPLMLVAGDSVQAQDSLTRGKVLDTINCNETSGQSYALYLPESYDPEIPHAIIYIFDPAARGALGVNVFREAAERYGFILVCSNNARNGSWDIVFNAANAIFADTEKKLNLNLDRRYTAGFSGGSRAALAIAVLSEGKIRGVIGCGAAFPPLAEYQPRKEDTFHYIALVAQRDMNFHEHQVASEKLTQIGISNSLYIFDGVHQWPAPSVVEIALAELDLLHASLEKAEYVDLLLRQLMTTIDLGYPGLAKKQISRIGQWLLPPHIQLDPVLDSIAQKKYRKSIRDNERIFALEGDLIDRYLQAFSHLYSAGTLASNDFTWWKSEIDNLRTWTKGDDQVARKNLGARMLNLISARSAESAFRAETNGNLDMAVLLTSIWMYADPDKAHPYWYRAKLFALKDMSQPALDLLEQAYDKGMRKWQSLQDPAFLPLRDLPGFQALMKRLRPGVSNDRLR